MPPLSDNHQPQSPTPITSELPSSKKLISQIILLGFFLATILVSYFWITNKLNLKKNQPGNPLQPTGQPLDQVTITGVIRSAGLSEEEKQSLNLNLVEYQVTDFGDYQKAYLENKILGYFLITDQINDQLLGQCTRVTGEILGNWSEKEKSSMYNHSVLEVSQIEKIDYSGCRPYGDKLIFDNSQDKLTFQGIPIHSNRPAPDIGYDYQLKLDQPFKDKLSALDPNQEVSLLAIWPTTNDLWVTLENNLGQQILVEGYMAWGYAETRYFEITAIKNNQAGEVNEIDLYSQAIDKLNQIAEIDKIKRMVIQAGRKPFYINEGIDGYVVSVSLRESFPDDPHTTRIDSFQVNLETGIITVLDIASNDYLPLEKWQEETNRSWGFGN
ncbi:hypothetical protein ACFLZP_04210 [Patescibacteria group bacterium]